MSIRTFFTFSSSVVSCFWLLVSILSEAILCIHFALYLPSPGVLLFEAVTGYLAIALGALSWWFGITYFVNKVRARFNLRGIWILNRVIGSIVAIVSILGLVFTLMGESLY